MHSKRFDKISRPSSNTWCEVWSISCDVSMSRFSGVHSYRGLDLSLLSRIWLASKTMTGISLFIIGRYSKSRDSTAKFARWRLGKQEPHEYVVHTGTYIVHHILWACMWTLSLTRISILRTEAFCSFFLRFFEPWNSLRREASSFLYSPPIHRYICACLLASVDHMWVHRYLYMCTYCFLMDGRRCCCCCCAPCHTCAYIQLYCNICVWKIFLLFLGLCLPARLCWTPTSTELD